MTKAWETIAKSVNSRIWTMEKEGVGTITTFRISDPNRAIGGSRHHTIAYKYEVHSIRSWLDLEKKMEEVALRYSVAAILQSVQVS